LDCKVEAYRYLEQVAVYIDFKIAAAQPGVTFGDRKAEAVAFRGSTCRRV
jgi:hypothetical protein